MASLSTKQRLIATPYGRRLVAIRDVLRSTYTMFRDPEKACNLAQDRIYGALLPELCPPGGVFVDVGSHIGSVVAAVLAVNPSATVHAIEAVPEKAESIRTRFPRVTVHACAVGAQDGSVSFYVDPLRPGYSSLEAKEGRQKIEIPMRRLDDIVPRAHVVKIDVEGHELAVLEGATRLVAECRPIITFESARYDRAHVLWEWFNSHGYRIYAPDRFRHTAPGLALDAFVDSHHYPRRSTNYLAVPNSAPVPPVRYRAMDTADGVTAATA